MCSINYTYVGPALLVVPLFLISLVNLFVAGPPLKTIVLDSAGPTFGASLPFMRLDVAERTAKFVLTPKDEMTHFFVVTCYTPANSAPIALEASVVGKRALPGDASGKLLEQQALNHEMPHPSTAPAPGAAAGSAAGGRPQSSLQLLQPLLGLSLIHI